jgi:hypothetical protein
MQNQILSHTRIYFFEKFKSMLLSGICCTFNEFNIQVHPVQRHNERRS